MFLLEFDAIQLYLHSYIHFHSSTDDIPANVSEYTDVILHEMGHVLGFGTMWNYLGFYSATCTPGTPGPIYYTGAFGNAAYDTTNCPTWSADPLIETLAGPGSGCGH